MKNKEKRSIILAMTVADGCLHYIKNNGLLYGGLTIGHGLQQLDYINWKADLLSKSVNKKVNVRIGKKSAQFSFSMKRMRAWKKFFYYNNTKNIPKILNFISPDHYDMALAIFFMDDGYCEPSISKLKDGTKKNYGFRLRLFFCDQTDNNLNLIIEWFKKNFNVNPKVHRTFSKRDNKYVPFLKLNQHDSIILWIRMRKTVLQINSMKYKFRYAEEIYNKKLLQCATP